MMAQRVLNSRKRSNLYWGKYTLKQPVDLDFIATIVIKIATTTQQMILLTNGNGSNEYEDDRGDKQRSLRGGGVENLILPLKICEIHWKWYELACHMYTYTQLKIYSKSPVCLVCLSVELNSGFCPYLPYKLHKGNTFNDQNRSSHIVYGSI